LAVWPGPDDRAAGASSQGIRELQQRAAASLEIAVGGALIAAHHLPAVSIAQGAGFDVEEDLHLPGLKGIAAIRPRNSSVISLLN